VKFKSFNVTAAAILKPFPESSQASEGGELDHIYLAPIELLLQTHALLSCTSNTSKVDIQYSGTKFIKVFSV
jgi:hypothetical protein